ncbi:M20 family metallopeptidase [Bosea sp. BH3]|uniref:M20 family metallopeptidase n=1 Tax=Bosea sp. BH3 TaxID=2871701 RepID=UPI0021CB44FD|nr:M20 family metallopeptidase [Bosea sp. BH3]MCU4180398.1 M20 family metallopeptidase [Bosea sp. BH3]
MPHEAVTAAVAARKEALTAFLAQIVNMDSPTLDKPLCDAVAAVLEAKVRSIGMSVERDPQSEYGDNLVCRAGQDRPGPRVLLVGHFDTVYAAGTVAKRPWKVEGDKAYGCGLYDMKGGLALGIFALEALASVRGGFPLPVTFIFNSDEELGSKASRRVIIEEAKKHDLALVLEPGRPGPSLTISRKGVGFFHIVVTGQEAHAGAEPENGRNAVVEAAHKIVAIEALNAWDLGTTITPGVVSGGSKPHVVPGHAEIEIDCRVTSAAEEARVIAAIHAIAASSTVPGTSATITGGFHRSPMEPSEASLAFSAQFRAIAADVGFALGEASSGGGSDGNLTGAAGTPTLDGLGVHGGRAHSPDEFLEIASIEGKCRALAAFLDTLASARG